MIVTNTQSGTNVHEVSDGIYHINTPVVFENGNSFSFNQYLIVDDEPLARKDLISILSDINQIQIIGEADSIDTAKEQIINLTPDLIFLDIQMPGKSGFELLDLVELNAKVIFVTAFDEFAIRAFEINALDYLLKPINPERLKTRL